MGDDDGHGRDATATGETRRDATAMMEEPRRESVALEAQLGPRLQLVLLLFMLRWTAASTAALRRFCWLRRQRRRTVRSRGDRARARGLDRGRRSRSRWPSSSRFCCSRRCCLTRMTAASRTTLARCSRTSRRTSTAKEPARETARKPFGNGSVAATLMAR